MQPSKHASVADVLRVSSPYDAKTSPEMGHFIREARKLTRNNTFIGLEATKDDSNEHIQSLKESLLNRWSSAENVSSDRQDRTVHGVARAEDKMAMMVPMKIGPLTDGSEIVGGDSCEVKEKHPNDRRFSMIPLMCPPSGRPKAVQSQVDREKMRKKPPLPPPKVLVKHQDPIKLYRAERLQEKKMDLEQQLDDLKQQITCIQLARQREDDHNREVIDHLKREIDNLKYAWI